MRGGVIYIANIFPISSMSGSFMVEATSCHSESQQCLAPKALLTQSQQLSRCCAPELGHIRTRTYPPKKQPVQ